VIPFEAIRNIPMEKAPKKELTLEEIVAKIGELSHKKIELEDQIGRTHFESGDNSSDDQGQEQVMDDQATSVVAYQIDGIQKELEELEELRHAKTA
jgi:hypothetical protein